LLVCQSPSLYKLKIEDNKIDSVNKFYCLNQLKLKKINVKGNLFCSEKNLNYRNELFNNIKALESIDNLGKNDENVESTEYVEEENYGGEEFEEAESGEENYEENKIEGVEEIEEEENEEGDEHNFDEDKNKEKTDEELNTKRKRN
jgi:hypothetical protein